MNILALSLLALVLAIGLTYYAHSLMKLFREGALEKPFKILVLAGAIFVGSSVFGFLEELTIAQEVSKMMRVSLGSLFLLTLFWGFHRIHELWVSVSKPRVVNE